MQFGLNTIMPKVKGQHENWFQDVDNPKASTEANIKAFGRDTPKTQALKMRL